MCVLKDHLRKTINAKSCAVAWTHRYESLPFVTSEALVERLEVAGPDVLKGFVGPFPHNHAVRQPDCRSHLYQNERRAIPRDPHGWGPKAAGRQHRGVPTRAPMDLPVEIGVFAGESDVGVEDQQMLYRRKQRLKNGTQKITVKVGGNLLAPA